MKEKVLIPTRGVIALDIINSLNSMGMETLLMHSPEDSLSLPVKLADRSYKFYSSRLEDSYLDSEAILEKAREVHAD
ncbi:MAG TPA: biotin carboxylase N-terminal domain-containing protein, partial [Acidobacteriota bacterium]